MSDGIKAAAEAEEDYEYLCKKYNQPYVDVYGLHSDMLRQLDRDCHFKLPPDQHPKRIKQFEEEYAKAVADKKAEKKRREKRFKELMETLSSDDISILREYREDMWRY